MTVSIRKPVLTRVWFKRFVGTALLLNPVTLPELGVAVQVNKVPATSEVRVTLVCWLLQICSLKGLFERSGVGLTVTT